MNFITLIISKVQRKSMFKLRPLPYDFGALEPYIDARIMELHHDKHQAAYVNNLNKAIEKYPELHSLSLESLLTSLEQVPEEVRTAVRNNAGGDFNHAFFWQVMKKDGGGAPKGKSAEEIIKRFGSFSAFKDDFSQAAKSVFGSGWAWLVMQKNGDIAVITTPNQDSPLLKSAQPILGLDVWEHAYYLQYENRRPDYIEAWWHVVDWDKVEENYRDLVGS
jgi:Fe-Mn family superoxide dismutase